MRPIIRGNWPQNSRGENIEFHDYSQARGELICRLGEFCSYCEMHLDSSLHVEHVKPKRPPGATVDDLSRALDWNNFLLACANCNSTKRNTEVILSEYLWPDADNTFRSLRYSEGGVISAASGLPANIQTKAKNTIFLTGLDKHPLNDSAASDRRWSNRRETWDIAIRAKARLLRNNNTDFREQIVETATGHAYWSVWMTVFEDDTDMLRRLIEAFWGTCLGCFDATNGYEPVQRTGGQC